MGRLKNIVIAAIVLIFVSCEPIGLLLSIMETADPPGWELVQTLTAGVDGSASDEFGISVDVYEDYAIVGASKSEEGGSFRGAAYIYHLDRTAEKDPWKLEQKIPSHDNVDFDVFGDKVAITGEYAVVSSQQPSYEIEIFERAGTQWNYLTNIAHGSWTYLSSIDIYGDHMAVGDKGSDGAYFYRLDGGIWGLVDIENGSGLNSFGTSVSLYRGEAVVGEPEKEEGLVTGVGAAFIYQWSGSTWILVPNGELNPYSNPLDAISGTKFGTAVAMHDGKIVVGTLGTNTAYLYSQENSDWIADGTLSIDDVQVGDEMGHAVSITDRMIALGAPVSSSSTGKAYVVEKFGDVWKSVTSSSGSAIADSYGSALAMYGDFLFVAAPKDDNALGVDAGSVYVFQRASFTGYKGE